MIHKKNNDGKTPLDVIKEILDQSHYQYLKEIVQLFHDYHIRQRWRVYCFPGEV